MLSAIAIRRSLSAQRQSVLLGVCVLYGAFPLIIAGLGMGLAQRFECSVSSIVYECAESPQLSAPISGLVFSHWLAIVTIPSAVLGVIGLLISLRFSSNVPSPQSTDASPPTAIFYRSRRYKVVAGLCGVLAERWNLPVLAVRTAAVVLLVVTSFLTLGLYLWCWIAFPSEPPIEST